MSGANFKGLSRQGKKFTYGENFQPSPCLLQHFFPIGPITIISRLLVYENYINASDYNYSESIHASLLHDADALPSYMHFYQWKPFLI